MSMGQEDEEIVHFNQTKRGEASYNPKKPKWWSKVSGNPTKPQKWAMNQLFQTHRLPSRKYGTMLDWATVLPPKYEQIWIEIGIGRGENLLALAHQKKDQAVALVGIEINKSGMGTACRRILKGIEAHAFWSEYTLYSTSIDPYNPAYEENGEISAERFETRRTEEYAAGSGDTPPYENVRLYPGDAVTLFPHIPTASVVAILLTFPDPFPGISEKQWRVVQVETILQIHRILRKSPNPGRFFVATDHEGYHSWCHNVMDDVNSENILFEKVEPCPDRSEWLPAVSRYEQKGWEEGRQSRLSCWAVKSMKI